MKRRLEVTVLTPKDPSNTTVMRDGDTLDLFNKGEDKAIIRLHFYAKRPFRKQQLLVHIHPWKPLEGAKL